MMSGCLPLAHLPGTKQPDGPTTELQGCTVTEGASQISSRGACPKTHDGPGERGRHQIQYTQLKIPHVRVRSVYSQPPDSVPHLIS